MPQYQGVWTLEQQAQAQSNQQWVTDPNFKNTTLLLQADGTGSGSQNQTFLDGSTNNFFITRNGNTTQGSFSPFSQAPGYWGNYFNGSSSLITPTSSATPLAIGSGDFTIEFWVNSAIPGSDVGILDNRAADGSSTGLGIGIGSSTGKIRLYSNVELFNAGVITANQFTHVAIVRSGTTGTVYINGISAGTISSWSTNFTDQGFKIGIGAGGNAMTGYISNFRFVKGTAVYTANFTPTTAPLTAITNTSLLTCQSNRFVDNSTNSYAITVNGGAPSVQAFGPFAPALQWTPDVVGGSAFFDGTGDNLTWTGTAAGSGAFSYEFWLYSIVDFSSNRAPLGVLAISGYNSALDVRMSGTTINMSAYNVANNNFTVPALVPNTWYHVVLCRNASNQATVFLNGVRSSTGAVTITQNFAGLTSVIGAQDAVSSPGDRTTGYLTNIRLIVGSTPYDPTQTTITVPTAPLTAITNTQLLTNYTNAGIYDGKMGNVLETVGNAQVATSPVKYGSGSMYFDGSGDYLTFPNSASSFQFSTGAFTIEFWYFPIASLTNAGLVDLRVNSSSNAGFLMRQGDGSSSGTTISCWAGNPGSTTAATQTGLVLNQWNHIAATRDSLNYLRVFINGVSGTAVARSIDLTDSSCRIAAFVDATGSPNAANGFIDDLRITKGVARYIANFTPPQQALPRQ